MAEKIYVGTGRLIEFPKGGTALKFAFTEDDVTHLREHLSDGWVRILISERRTPSATGQTHYATIDTWRPDPARGKPPADPMDQRAPITEATENQAATRSDDDMPF